MYQSEDFYLMHKDIKVAKFSMTDYGTSVNVKEIYNKEHMPYGTHVDKKHLNEKFTEWKNDRRIPTERPYIMQIYKKTKKSIPELETLNLGLSRCDCYWFQPIDCDYKWKDINFHNNHFRDQDQIGKMLLNTSSDTPNGIKSPDITLNGECPKMWSVFDNTVYLIKGCRTFSDTKAEICNEVFASILAEKLGIDTVQYYLMRSGEHVDFCCAENFIKNDALEFVSFKQIANNTKTYGINGVLKYIKEHKMQKYLDQMIVLDFIIGNYNRTFSDIGILVSSETMEFVSPAPLFDYEESLDYNLMDGDISGAFCDDIKDQLKMVSDFTWINFEAIKNIIPEIDRIYSIGGFKSAEINKIKAYFKNRVNLLRKEIPAEQLKLTEKPKYTPRKKPVEKEKEEDQIIKIHREPKPEKREEENTENKKPFSTDLF